MFVVHVTAALVGETLVVAGGESANFEFPLEPARPVHPALKLAINKTAKKLNNVNGYFRLILLCARIPFPQFKVCW